MLPKAKQYCQNNPRNSYLQHGAVVALPNDPSNEGRALLILQKAGLIKLKKGVSTRASIKDIETNRYGFQFKLLDDAVLPRVLDDADLVAITDDYLNVVHLTIQQAILRESSRSPYANVIVVATKNKYKPIFKELISIMHSKEVISATDKVYPHGSAIVAWR